MERRITRKSLCLRHPRNMANPVVGSTARSIHLWKSSFIKKLLPMIGKAISRRGVSRQWMPHIPASDNASPSSMVCHVLAFFSRACVSCLVTLVFKWIMMDLISIPVSGITQSGKFSFLVNSFCETFALKEIRATLWNLKLLKWHQKDASQEKCSSD